jgi:ABC-type glycerol-3-phosphate transport system permease component
VKQSVRVQSARYVATIVIVVLTVFPIAWVALTAFKGPQEINAIPPTPFVKHPTLANFTEALDSGFGAALTNSVIVGIASTILAILLSAPAAYAFARYPFRGSRTILTGVLIVRMVPGIALVIPFFKMMKTLDILNTHTALIVTYLSFQVPFAIWLLEGFFRGLPRELEEAAMVDGCSRFRAFVSIVLPVAAVGMATTAIFCFIMSWNEFLYAVTFTSGPDSQTGPAAISQAITSYGISWGRMSASAVVFIAPVLLFSLFFQRFIVRGLTLGAVKG